MCSSQAEVRRISAIIQLPNQNRTRLQLSSPLSYTHYAGAEETYGSKKLRTHARVGLLTRNIVIRGEGQGEELPYTVWNIPQSDKVNECFDAKDSTS
jgi:hypothetical protein